MSLSWRDKYILALNETINLKQISLLRGCGSTKANTIKSAALRYCLENDLDTDGKNIPVEAIFAVTGKPLEFYYNKMIDEARIVALSEE